jgi:hypothetical protein
MAIISYSPIILSNLFRLAAVIFLRVVRRLFLAHFVYALYPP